MRGLRLAAVVLLGLAACVSDPSSSPDGGTLGTWLDSARSEVQATADGAVEALKRLDGEVALGLLASDFELVRADGEHQDRAAFVESRREAYARLVELAPESRITIGRILRWAPAQPWDSSSPEITFETLQHSVGTVRGEGDQLVSLASDIQAVETWRRTSEGWRRVKVVQRAGLQMAPAAEPEVTPQPETAPAG